MRSLSISLLCGSLCGLGAIAMAQERTPAPRFDPFDRPSFQGPVETHRSVRITGWSPWLKATLVAGPHSMANLGGVVLELGEETHGYRLIEVREWDAVFSRDGEKVVFAVVPPVEPQP